MSKIICDICGTQYDDSVGSCPVCGWDQKGDLPADIGDFDSDFLDDLQTDIPVPGAAPVKPVAPKIPSAAPKAKTAFDYDAANARTRPAPKKSAPVVEDEDDDEDEEEDCFMTTCPECEEEVYFDESVLEDGEVVCPNCGTKLEFDLSDLANALNDADEDEDDE